MIVYTVSGVRNDFLSSIILLTMLNVTLEETVNTRMTRTACGKWHNTGNMRWLSTI